MVYQFSLPPLLAACPAARQCAVADTMGSRTAACPGMGVRISTLPSSLTGWEYDRSRDWCPLKNSSTWSTPYSAATVGSLNKKNPDGSESPYELNITYYDALACEGGTDDGNQTDRFLCSQAIMLSLQGVPGIYIHALTAVKMTLKASPGRAIIVPSTVNSGSGRHLEHALDDENTSTGQVFDRYLHLLKIRSASRLLIQPLSKGIWIWAMHFLPISGLPRKEPCFVCSM